MTYIKKTACFLLALLLLAGVLPAAFAEPLTYDMRESGLSLVIPEQFADLNGVLIPERFGEISDGIYYVYLGYLGTTEADYKAFTARKDATAEEAEAMERKFRDVCYLFCIDGNRDFTDIGTLAQGLFDEAEVIEVAKNGEYTHYAVVLPDEEYRSVMDKQFADEYEALAAAVPAIIEASSFFEPASIFERVLGSKLQFETTDVDGNPVKSEDIFSSGIITMLNIWTSWCGPCIRELPELEKISGRLSKLGCSLVGLLYDGNDADALAKGKQLMKDNGVTYPVILPPENMNEILPLNAYPTTYFVNSDGIIVGTPIVGAYVNEYEKAVSALLEASAENP